MNAVICAELPANTDHIEALQAGHYERGGS